LSVLAEPFALHPLVLVAAPSHPLAQRGKLPVSALEGEDFIIREIGSGCRHAVEQFLSVHSVNPHITMEIPNNETIKQAVIAGMGMSIMSLHTIGLELRNNLLTIVDMEDLPIMRTWHVVHLQSKVLSLAAEALRHYLLEQGEAYFVNDAVFSQYTFAEHSAQLIETAKNLTLSTMN
jgi:DNA-binding transcriptional LysR family regulator